MLKPTWPNEPPRTCSMQQSNIFAQRGVSATTESGDMSLVCWAVCVRMRSPTCLNQPSRTRWTSNTHNTWAREWASLKTDVVSKLCFLFATSVEVRCDHWNVSIVTEILMPETGEVKSSEISNTHPYMLLSLQAQSTLGSVTTAAGHAVPKDLCENLINALKLLATSSKDGDTPIESVETSLCERSRKRNCGGSEKLY